MISENPPMLDYALTLAVQEKARVRERFEQQSLKHYKPLFRVSLTDQGIPEVIIVLNRDMPAEIRAALSEGIAYRLDFRVAIPPPSVVQPAEGRVE